MKNKRFVAGVLVPIFLLIIVFLFVPLLLGLGISFFDYNPLRAQNQFIGLNNYFKLARDPVFLKVLNNTVFFVFVTVLFNILFTLGLSIFISALPSNKTRSFFRMMYFLPCIAPMVGSTSVWGSRVFSTRTGILNTILVQLGGKPINFLGNADTVMWAIIAFTIWVDFGYNTILFSAGLDAIPGTYQDAAKIDGANAWQRFTRITLPLLERTFVFVLIMTLISHFQMIVQFMTLATRGGPNYASTVLTLYVYNLGFVTKDMGYASAVAMVLFVIIMAVTLVQRRFMKTDWGY